MQLYPNVKGPLFVQRNLISKRWYIHGYVPGVSAAVRVRASDTSFRTKGEAQAALKEMTHDK